MEKLEFLDLIGTEKVVENIMEILDSHSSDNNIHFSSGEKDNLSQAYEHSVSDHAPTDAEKNIIVGVQKNGEDLPVDEETRKIDVSVPTKLSEFENDTGFITQLTGGGVLYDLNKENNEIVLTGTDGSKTSVKDEVESIVNTASGENIHLTDSADSKAVEFALYGKATQETTTGAQLLNYDAWKIAGIINGTSVFENNGVTIIATSNDAYTKYHTDEFSENAKIPVSEGDVITLSWEENSNKEGGVFFFPNGLTSGCVNVNNNVAKSLTYTVPSGVTFLTYRFGVKYSGDTISYKNIMINKGSTALPYEKFTGGKPSPSPDYSQEIEVAGSSGSVVAKSCGKNLLENMCFSRTNSGITITLNEDKSVTVNGTATNTLFIGIAENFDKFGKFIMTGCPYENDNQGYGLFFKENGVNWYQWDTGKGARFNTELGKKYNVTLYIPNGTTVNNVTVYPMIRKCDENDNPIGDDTYEPYKETSSTILTPNGLAGIPVDSGGNYMDSEGQQWVCDEIVKYADGSGEYVQRVKEIMFDGTENWAGSGTNFSDSLGFNYIATDKKRGGWFNIRSSLTPYITQDEYYYYTDNSGVGGIDYYITFKLNRSLLNNASGTNTENVSLFKEFLASKYNEGNPVKVLYQLETPICTPLTAEQIAEIEKLCTFYQVTNISNDADCGMEIKYFKDTLDGNYVSVLQNTIGNISSVLDAINRKVV